MPESGHKLFGVTWDHRRVDRPSAPRLGRTLTLALAAAASVAVPLQASAASPARNAIRPARGPATSVIVRAAPAREQAAEAAVLASGGSVSARFGLINGFAASVPQGALTELRADSDILGVTSNAAAHLLGTSYAPTADLGSMASTTANYGAQAYWSAGHFGRGVDVALIDSGVAPVEGLLAERKVLNGPDLSSESNGPLRTVDTFGHGTHMAGIIAGLDQGGDDNDGRAGRFLGMAPGARLVSIKVADRNGNTNLVQLLAAIEWVVQHRADEGLNIRVLNLSFGVDSALPFTSDPLALAVHAAWNNGIFVTAAAGNDGLTPNFAGLADPAYDPTIMAVGATQSVDGQPAHDLVPGFSSWAPTSLARRPDMVAPGAHIQSLRAPGSFIDVNHGATGRLGDRFFRGSGTSQAAAAVSGAAALIFSQHPEATPEQVKDLLTGTATRLAHTNTNAQGSGVLNLGAALGTPLMSGGINHVSDRSGSHGQGQGLPPAPATSLAGSSWSGGFWSGGSWLGGSWSGSSWSGSSWSGSSWSGGSWSGSSWSGSSWSGSSWSGSSWSGSSWSGSSWSGSSWSGSSWSGSRWD